MNALCDSQLHFSFCHDRRIRLDFDGGLITSDAGLISLREFDHRIGFTQSITKRLTDHRHPSYIRHSLSELLIPRLYGIIAGYEDQNDAQRLRHDGLFQLIAGKPHLGRKLASQSSISRLENSISPSEVGALNDLLTDTFIQSQHAPSLLIIELDSTDDPAHGQQQLIGFNGFYGQYMYHPLLIHEGTSGCILGTFLRPGNAHAAEDVLPALEPIVKRLQAAFPNTHIELRADAGFAVPRLYRFCERHGIGFTIAIATNRVLHRHAEPLVGQAVKLWQQTGRKARLYDQFAHRAHTWDNHLRVLIKAEAGAEGTNTRFVVTNMPGDPQRLFDFYEDRGQAENHIKELKNQLKADRLSCHRFEANAFRLVLHALAYQLINLFRSSLSDPQLRSAQTKTLRCKLFKVGALLRQTTRRFWLHLASGWPHQELLAAALADVMALPPPSCSAPT